MSEIAQAQIDRLIFADLRNIPLALQLAKASGLVDWFTEKHLSSNCCHRYLPWTDESRERRALDMIANFPTDIHEMDNDGSSKTMIAWTELSESEYREMSRFNRNVSFHASSYLSNTFYKIIIIQYL